MGSNAKILTFWGQILSDVFFSDFAETFPRVVLTSRNSSIRSDLQGFAIFRVKIGVKGWNFDFYKVKFGPKFRSLTPFFTLKMTKPCKTDTTSEFLNLKSYSSENFSKTKEKIPDQIWPQKVKILSFDPIFDPDNDIIMQIWHDQWISRCRKLFWWKFQPNRRKFFFKFCYKKR